MSSNNQIYKVSIVIVGDNQGLALVEKDNVYNWLDTNIEWDETPIEAAWRIFKSHCYGIINDFDNSKVLDYEFDDSSGHHYTVGIFLNSKIWGKSFDPKKTLKFMSLKYFNSYSALYPKVFHMSVKPLYHLGVNTSRKLHQILKV